jgi:hypothetical protein
VIWFGLVFGAPEAADTGNGNLVVGKWRRRLGAQVDLCLIRMLRGSRCLRSSGVVQ